MTRGNTNLLRLQPIDRASWIWTSDDPTPDCSFQKFRKRFSVKPGDGKLTVDVSADERFYLTLDGEFVARGPNRAVVENWQYQTYAFDLAEGEHVFEATVWRTTDHGPLAQLSWRGGFILKAEGAYDDRLTTGKTNWEVGAIGGLKPIGKGDCCWSVGFEPEKIKKKITSAETLGF